MSSLSELISAVPSSNPTFVARNFTDAEVVYCQAQPSPAASFAARWVGKEAVFKSLGVPSKGAAAAMKDIEILPDESGVPAVHLHGEAKVAADAKGITKVHISLSHSEVSSSITLRPDHVLMVTCRPLLSPLLRPPPHERSYDRIILLSRATYSGLSAAFHVLS